MTRQIIYGSLKQQNKVQELRKNILRDRIAQGTCFTLGTVGTTLFSVGGLILSSKYGNGLAVPEIIIPSALGGVVTALYTGYRVSNYESRIRNMKAGLDNMLDSQQ